MVRSMREKIACRLKLKDRRRTVGPANADGQLTDRLDPDAGLTDSLSKLADSPVLPRVPTAASV